MKLFEKTIKKNDIFNGRVIKLHVDKVELENGKISSREMIEHPGGVSVAVLTEKNEVIFVRQFRYPYKEVVLELPAGKLEPGEDPFEAMKREQMEETGTSSDEYIFLGEIYPTPGYTNEIIRLWACRQKATASMNLDEDEFLETVKIPFEEAYKMVMNGEIKDGKTQIGILKLKEVMDKL